MDKKVHLLKSYSNILVSEVENPGGLKVGLIELNRPKALNALNTELMGEVAEALHAFDKDAEIGCSVITGSEKAFAAGSDIKEMAEMNSVDAYSAEMFSAWDRIRLMKKPVIASVSGYALGGGCELAMLCDMIVASECAKFGQPEINLAVIPGAGGTQRLTRAVGKARAMEMILTGKMFSAREMFEAGLVTRVVEDGKFLEESLNLAKDIAVKPALAVQLAKECILKSFDTTIETGIEFERKNFYLLFSSGDKQEGMKAFIEKRKAVWKGK
ncbi:MAG: enoyl-CoA hydratase-related protein [Ignavibacteriae bacterium]|nr:enoyl-CoA hydratase-related protein [Ignavibacteriota bacterium]